VWSAVLIALAPGCHLVSGDKPVAVLVRDAETGKPVRGAEVRVACTHASASPLAHAGGFAQSGDDGVARLAVCPEDGFGASVRTEAAGYLYEDDYLSAEALGAIEPPSFWSKSEGKPSLVMALYAAPSPSVEMVVPDGFRGVITAEVSAVDKTPAQPGIRNFSFAVSPEGKVQVVGPAILRKAKALDFTARYAAGTPLTQEAKEAEVGMWWLTTEGDRHTFLVGTRAEYEQKRPANGKSSDGTDTPSRGGRGGGGGRRGGGRRGGGQPPS
jgi:hypothetical protein